MMVGPINRIPQPDAHRRIELQVVGGEDRFAGRGVARARSRSSTIAATAAALAGSFIARLEIEQLVDRLLLDEGQDERGPSAGLGERVGMPAAERQAWMYGMIVVHRNADLLQVVGALQARPA